MKDIKEIADTQMCSDWLAELQTSQRAAIAVHVVALVLYHHPLSFFM